MAKPNKASITYSTGVNKETEEAVNKVLRFHTVVAEQHQTSAEVTKFPVASQKYVSNHSIRKNRKVSITGVVSNHVIVGQGEMHEYGQANAQIVFAEFKRLIQEGVPCKVNTNLSIYNPVIFTNLQTKQEAGMTDAMKFVLSGEEIILGTSVNYTTPTVLDFEPLDDEDRKSRIYSLLQAGLSVPDSAVLSEAEFDPDKSFVLSTVADNGKAVEVTYERMGYDHTTKTYQHLVHTSDVSAVNGESTEDTWKSYRLENAALPDTKLPRGAETLSSCVLRHGAEVRTELIKGKVDTALGALRKSAYGAAYKIIGVNGDKSFGQVLLGVGLDCFVVGLVGGLSDDPTAESFEANLPTTDAVISGATSLGKEILSKVTGVPSSSTVLKISSPNTPISFFGGVV